MPHSQSSSQGLAPLFATLGVVGVATLVYKGFRLRQKERDMVKDGPPGSLGIWGLGEMLSFLSAPLDFDKHRIRKYGMNFTTHILFAPAIRCNTVEDRQRVFRSEGKGESFIAWPAHWQKLLGYNAVTSVTGDRHVFLRKFFHVYFTPEFLKAYTSTIDKCITGFLNNLNDGKTHASTDFKMLAMDIFLQTIFGGRSSQEEVKAFSSVFTTWIDGLGALLPYEIPFTTYGNAMKARKQLLERIQELVQRSDGSGTDLLSKFVSYRDENGDGLTNDEILENILVLIFAGHDTTAASFGTIISYLFDPENANILERLRDELQKVTTMDDQVLKNCTYLLAVIDEAWREMPPILGSFREALKDIVLSDGTIVHPGVRMGTSTVMGHHDIDIWGPRGFDPDRFNRVKQENPTALRTHYYPFGQGNRLCVGEQLARMELRIFIYRLVREYDLKIVNVKHVPFPINCYLCNFVLHTRSVTA